jgi:hypothetical protein
VCTNAQVDVRARVAAARTVDTPQEERMRYLVRVEGQGKAIEDLDAAGGPGPLFKYIGERWRPEAFYIGVDRRHAFWVIDFPDAASIVELTHLTLAKVGASPELTLVMTPPEAAKAIPEAYAKAHSPVG